MYNVVKCVTSVGCFCQGAPSTLAHALVHSCCLGLGCGGSCHIIVWRRSQACCTHPQAVETAKAS